jgi:hypothetical protein
VPCGQADDPDRAIAAFGDALDHGYAYPAALIRDDGVLDRALAFLRA